MDTFERNGARALAIAYHGYMDALVDPDCTVPRLHNWARLLIRAQRETSVELLPVSSLLYPDPLSVHNGFHPPGFDPEGCDACKASEPRGQLRSQSGMIEGGADDDGGALVPAPKPIPRKPSPGAAASPASAAAAFYAIR